MKLTHTRIPLVIALSTALAFSVGCTDRTADDRTAMQSADESAAQVEPVTAEPATPAVVTEGNSEQPGTDTWITTKVKAALLADTDVAGLDINVETVNGVVTLIGQVAEQTQIDEAARIARAIEGVTDVQTTTLVVGAK